LDYILTVLKKSQRMLGILPGIIEKEFGFRHGNITLIAYFTAEGSRFVKVPARQAPSL
jgi:hypothetical protein